MYIFYVLALLPILVGAFFLWKNREVVWWEYLIAGASTFLVAGLIHGIVLLTSSHDTETWSGQIVKVSHYPRWVEEYIEVHVETETDSDGNTSTRTYTTIEHDTHPEHWRGIADFGSLESWEYISQEEFHEIGSKFGNKLITDGRQLPIHGGHFDGGDDNIYSINNETGYLEPVTKKLSFKNKIKSAPSVFSFSKVPTNINVLDYPENSDWRHSDRLLGTASILIDRYQWDCLNSRLGASKKVNLIIVGFGKVPSDYGHYQQAKWLGGKKNDLVLCYGGAGKNTGAKWAYVFSWCENELVKKNLQTILLEFPINNDLIPRIEEEVRKNYKIKDWSKFDYISIEPPTWSYWIFFIITVLTQVGLYVYFTSNEYIKEELGWSSKHNFWR